MSTEPRSSDLRGAPLCASFGAVDSRRVEGDIYAPPPRSGACATLDGLIQTEGERLWKLLIGKHDMAFVTGPFFPNVSTPDSIPAALVDCGRGCLYDLSGDPLEANDLAALMPQRVATMRARLEELLPTAFNPRRGQEDPAACEVALQRYGGFWGPFVGV